MQNGPRKSSFRILRFAFCVLIAIVSARSSHAGGGPENVFLVVNSRSWASKTVANHFIHARGLPLSNVLYVDWEDDVDAADVKVFREKILAPVLIMIQRRGLGTQIDYLVYSADFPYAINLNSELGQITPPQYLPPVGSLTGMTFFYGPLMTLSPLAIGLDNNHYFHGEETSSGFRGWYGWGSNGELHEAGGDQYLLSTMLAYTSGRGNSVREAVQALERSAAADGTQPKGTIYYLRNGDVRSKVRHDGFPDAVAQLRKLKVAAEEIEGTLPPKKKDVQGAVIGASSFDWAGSGSTILPGAICENFTSFGGVLREAAGQTPLTEFIRFGAAGSSGAVVEPFAIPQKFPSPALQVHYARGCSLAEAFYQSVHGPYQLLIVGDPLCRPWAKIPKITVKGADAGGRVKGKLTLQPAAQTNGETVDRFELFLDGVRVQTVAPNMPFEIDTERYPDGAHEARVVGIEADPIESQGRIVLPLTFDNRGQTLDLTAPGKTARWGEPLKISAKTKRAVAILVYHNSQLLGRIEGSAGELSLEPRDLGEGPIELRGFAIGTGEATDRVISQPLQLTIEPNKPLPEQRLTNLKLGDGLNLRLSAEKTVVVQDTSPADWLAKTGVEAAKPFSLTGYFQAPREEIYQFQLHHTGDLRLLVDGTEFYKGDGKLGWQYVPVNLARGGHRLEISGTVGTPPQLLIRFGGPGAVSLNGKVFQHIQ